ncbi:MAG TPA: hypothetical protein VNT99_11975, partial [Methylomirabilota bacterium]|nr:hypothetical protein [Methylomirabilota bacterium]
MTPMLLPRILAIALALACHAGAGEVFWTNNFGGIYSEPLNWSAGVPGSADTASFTNSSQFPVLFTNAAELHTARFFRGVVTQDIGAALWVVTNRWQVGEATGEAAKVVHTSGVLAVTNAGRSAILEVGRIGTGELDIRGGNIVADVLLATNLARSKLNHSHGSLTFLN